MASLALSAQPQPWCRSGQLINVMSWDTAAVSKLQQINCSHTRAAVVYCCITVYGAALQVEVKEVTHAIGIAKQTAWHDDAGVKAGETTLAYVQPGTTLLVPVSNLRSTELQRFGPQQEVDGGERQTGAQQLECNDGCSGWLWWRQFW